MIKVDQNKFKLIHMKGLSKMARRREMFFTGKKVVIGIDGSDNSVNAIDCKFNLVYAIC